MKSILIFAFLTLLIVGTINSAENPFESGSKIVFGSIGYSNVGGDAYIDEKRIIVSPGFGILKDNHVFYSFSAHYEYHQLNDYLYSRHIKHGSSYYGLGVSCGKYFFIPENPASGTAFYYEFLGSYLNQSSDPVITLGSSLGLTKMLSSSVGLDISLTGTFDVISINNSLVGVSFYFVIGVKSFIF